MLVTALLWIPASCVISYVDRKRRREEFERWEWRNKNDLIHSSDNIKRVIHIRVPNRNRTQGQSSSRNVIPE